MYLEECLHNICANFYSKKKWNKFMTALNYELKKLLFLFLPFPVLSFIFRPEKSVQRRSWSSGEPRLLQLYFAFLLHIFFSSLGKPGFSRRTVNLTIYYSTSQFLPSELGYHTREFWFWNIHNFKTLTFQLEKILLIATALFII